MKSKRHVILTLIFGFGLSACVKGVPKFDNLNMGVSQPNFNGAVEKSFSIATYNASLTVSGSCDIRVRNLSISGDNGATWQVLTPGVGDDLDCLDTTFSFKILDCSIFGFSNLSASGEIRTILLRGETIGDPTGSSQIHIQLSSSHKVNFAAVESGGGHMIGTSYKIVSRIGAPVSANTMTGSSHKIKLQKAE